MISGIGRSRGAFGLACVCALGLAFLGSGAPAAGAAEACPNEAIREQQGSTGLADCRAYEMVSPPEKNNGDITNERGVFSDPAGNHVSFGSFIAFANPQSGPVTSTYLSSRVNGDWSTGSLNDPLDPQNNILPTTKLAAFSSDYSKALVYYPLGSDPGLAPGAPPGGSSLYLRNLISGSYELVAPGTKEEINSFSTPLPRAWSQDLSHILLSTPEALTPGAPTLSLPATNLYEWVDGHLTLASVLPNGLANPNGGDNGNFDGGTAMSADGSRIAYLDSFGTSYYFTKEGVTTQVNAPEGSPVVPLDSSGDRPEEAYTPTLSHLYFIGGSGNARDLYEYDAQSGLLSNLTAASDPGGAGASTIFGASDDGSYVYFKAAAQLVPGKGVAGGPNIYVWHNGTISYVATANPSSSIDNVARRWWVTPDGTHLVFRATQQVTSYDNAGFAEYYGYDATTDILTCLSCNPSGAPPTGDAHGGPAGPNTATFGGPYGLHNLSEDGSRFFFDSPDALVPQDTNGRTDVYESENGVLHLISSGQSATPSEFGDASASGDDVFFFTSEPLVGQDRDGNVDIYDARVFGGIASQNLPAAAPPCAGEDCRGQVAAPPAGASPASSSVVSSPNRKYRRKRHPRREKHHGKPHHTKSHHGRTAGNGRGSVK